MRLTRVVPEGIRLASGGRARLVVAGHGFGVITCQGARRFVFGDFDEGFLVEVGPQDTEVRVTARSWTGSTALSIPVRWVADLHRPRAAHIDHARLHAPRGMRVTTTRPTLPRTVSVRAERLAAVRDALTTGEEAAS